MLLDDVYRHRIKALVVGRPLHEEICLATYIHKVLLDV